MKKRIHSILNDDTDNSPSRWGVLAVNASFALALCTPLLFTVTEAEAEPEKKKVTASLDSTIKPGVGDKITQKEIDCDVMFKGDKNAGTRVIPVHVIAGTYLYSSVEPKAGKATLGRITFSKLNEPYNHLLVTKDIGDGKITTGIATTFVAKKEFIRKNLAIRWTKTGKVSLYDVDINFNMVPEITITRNSEKRHETMTSAPRKRDAKEKGLEVKDADADIKLLHTLVNGDRRFVLNTTYSYIDKKGERQSIPFGTLQVGRVKDEGNPKVGSGFVQDGVSTQVHYNFDINEENDQIRIQAIFNHDDQPETTIEKVFSFSKTEVSSEELMKKMKLK